MGKREYAHMQKLLPDMQRMIAEGKSQREIAEAFGSKDKYVVNGCCGRNARKDSQEYNHQRILLKIGEMTLLRHLAT